MELWLVQCGKQAALVLLCCSPDTFDGVTEAQELAKRRAVSVLDLPPYRGQYDMICTRLTLTNDFVAHLPNGA
jgi:hypothetical protein